MRPIDPGSLLRARAAVSVPTVDHRAALPVTVLLLASSFAFALTAGFGLGTWLLLHAAVGVPLPEASWGALVQVHGHTQLLGFAGLLVMGIAYRIFPRFRGADDPSLREVLVAYGLVAGGLLLRPAQIWPDVPARDALLGASALAELAGMLVYARLVLRILTTGTNLHRADELFIGAGAVFGVVGALWGALAVSPLIGGGTAVDPAADRAHVAALLLGFVTSHVLGVSLRVAPAFIAARPARDRVVAAAAIAWVAGATLATLGEPLGALVLLATAVVVVRELGPFARSIAVREVQPAARTVRLAFRGAYAWLVVGILLLAFAGLEGAPLGAAVAGRHAIALGFLTQIVFGVGSRLIPAVTGGRAPSVAAVRAAIALANAAALLRVVFEVSGPTATVSATLLALSGPVSLASLLVFGAAAAGTVRSALAARGR